jgi:hypothetical protein
VDIKEGNQIKDGRKEGKRYALAVIGSTCTGGESFRRLPELFCSVHWM